MCARIHSWISYTTRIAQGKIDKLVEPFRIFLPKVAAVPLTRNELCPLTLNHLQIGPRRRTEFEPALADPTNDLMYKYGRHAEHLWWEWAWEWNIKSSLFTQVSRRQLESRTGINDPWSSRKEQALAWGYYLVHNSSKTLTRPPRVKLVGWWCYSGTDSEHMEKFKVD